MVSTQLEEGIAFAALPHRRTPVPCYAKRREETQITRRAAFSQDPWEVLGVGPEASQSEIKRAYRRRALKEHPDVNKGMGAKETWQELSRAYDILSDPQKRRAWEASVARQKQRAPRSQRQSGTGAPSRAEPRHGAPDVEYDALGDSFGSIFGDLLRRLGRKASTRSRGSGPTRHLRQVGSHVLEELVDFLEGSGRAEEGQASSQSRNERLRLAQEELATLNQLEENLRAEYHFWDQQAKSRRASGNRMGELGAMQKAFAANQRRANVKRRVLRAEVKVEHLIKV